MSPDPWAVLQAWDRLVVGPVRVQPRRIEMPYRIEADGQADERVLGVTWAEDVLDPDEPASVRIASLIGAQVALNYGLFAGEIVLHGPFDAFDRAFLQDMAENTAREIAVKKLLEPNVFLLPPALGLPAKPRAPWSRASLRFVDPVPVLPVESWPHREGAVAVLASGGKESLCTQGVLEELGYEVHALFGNESGRHWLTARNAFRWLSEHRPGTGRVWMDSDRLFAWFLRHLPFVRPDFAELRADDYPIRLWTVGVFAFAMLPLLRRRGLPWLVIGDEYDTTRVSRLDGIQHYDGLFDQSRFFDEALTALFRAHGWGVTVFSALRACSELMVQDRLAGRYPHLHRHQVSCHAGTSVGERTRPCGRCEKCRRIVGMLVATGHDPTACGYTPEQVRSCLDRVAAPGSHLEGTVLAEVLWRLVHRGVIPGDTPATAGARRMPEVDFLRFDLVNSPVDNVPAPLRAPLYRALLEGTAGALRWKDGRWTTYDVLADPAVAGTE